MSDQMSIFDFLDESQYLTAQEKVFETALERGSNTEDSFKRILDKINTPESEFADWLKKEFGIGGSCWTGYDTWWDSRGLQAGTNYDDRKLYSWKEVARAYKRKYGDNV